MVRSDEHETWRGSGGPGGQHHDGLIRVDAEGKQELRISPASAFKRPQAAKSGVLGKVCPPPLTKLSLNAVDKPFQLLDV